MKIKTQRGFTLAELLIVMAIIVVLAAVAIPTFGKQLETSRETGDMEIIRNAYTEALSIATLDGADGALNGVFGDGTAAAKTDANATWGAITHKGSGKYEVDLTHKSINAKFSQSSASKAWTYVNGTFMNRIVPQVDVSQTKLYFTFVISTDDGKVGNIQLKADEAAVPASDNNTPDDPSDDTEAKDAVGVAITLA